MLVGCGWSDLSAVWAWGESVKAAAGAAATSPRDGGPAGAGEVTGEYAMLRNALMAFMEFPFNIKNKASVHGDRPIIGMRAW